MPTAPDSITNICRRFVLAHPRLSVDELKDAWQQEGEAGIKPDKQAWYAARTSLESRYGVSLEDLPLKTDGTPNISGLLRLLIQNKPTLSQKQITNMLEADGLTFSPKLYHNALDDVQGTRSPKKKKKTAGWSAATRPTEPQNEHKADPLLKTGPRARYEPPRQPRKKAKNGRRKKAGRRQNHEFGFQVSEVEREIGQTFLRWEDEIDELIQRCREETNGPMIERLKTARRTIMGGLAEMLNVVASRG